MNYAFVLPGVLRTMKWAVDVSPSDLEEVRIPDGRELVRQYFRDMTLGARYERAVAELRAREDADVLTQDNLRVSTYLRSRGWSHVSVKPFVGVKLRELQAIPKGADLFETDSYDRAAIELLCRLCTCKGVREANATKFLYQKRPALIPILDSQVRQAIGLGWVETDREMFEIALNRFRQLGSTAGNSKALAAIASWFARHPDELGGIVLSRVRIADILAWMQTYAVQYYGLTT